VRLGLLSTARINELLVAGAREATGIDVVAIGSRDLQRARAQAEELDIVDAYGSYEEVLAAPEVEAVYVALPNSLHVEWSVRALEAGKHVLCEKPMSRHPAEVERAFDAAERAERVLAEAFMWRHHPQARRLVELASGIGSARLIRTAFSFLLERPGDLRLSAELEGGALMDVGCYCVSASRLVAGEPIAVAAQQVIGGDGVDVRLAATMRFDGDAMAVFDCALDLDGRDELEVVGPDGSLFLDDPWHSRRPAIEVRRADGSAERIEVPAVDPYACELEDFAAAVAGERPAPFGRVDAVGQARAIAALYESADSGRAVTLSG
jgi:D-xylose 1-dehydrogenase (NADP+, D-xylono-1,5-lactone-forming)